MSRDAMSNQASATARAVITAILQEGADSNTVQAGAFAIDPLLQLLLKLRSVGKLDQKEFWDLSSQVDRLGAVIGETVGLAGRAVMTLRVMGYDVSLLGRT